MPQRGPMFVLVCREGRLAVPALAEYIRRVNTNKWSDARNAAEAGSRSASIVAAPSDIWGLCWWTWEAWDEVRGSDPSWYIPWSIMTLDNLSVLRDRSSDHRPGLVEFNLYFGKAGTGYSGAFPPDSDPAKMELLLSSWKEAADLFRPEYAVMDDWATRIKKRLFTDLRRRAWGVTVYGPEFVEVLGRERLLDAPAFRVEELSWGGVWVQLMRNPFEPDWRAVKALGEYLDLEYVFGEAKPRPPRQEAVARVERRAREAVERALEREASAPVDEVPRELPARMVLPASRLATNAPAYWPVVEVPALDELGKAVLSYTLDNLFAVRFVGTEGLRFAGLREEPIVPGDLPRRHFVVEDHGAPVRVLVYPAPSERMAKDFARIRAYLRERGEPEPVWYAPSPLPEVEAGGRGE